LPHGPTGLRGFLPLRVIVANSVEDIVKKGCVYIIYVLVKRAYEAAFGSLAGRYLHNLVVGYLTALLNSVPMCVDSQSIATLRGSYNCVLRRRYGAF
jgi:hypothetical protein